MDAADTWSKFGGLAAVVGAFPGVVGVAEVNPHWNQLLLNPVFDVGLFFEAIALFALLRFAYLRLAHLHLQGERCPDPAAHLLPSPHADPTRVAGKVPDAIADPAARTPPPQLLSVLRQIHGDLETSIRLVRRAVETDRYWRTSEGPLPNRAWRKNRQGLAASAEVNTKFYEDLKRAFDEVGRINGFHFPRSLQGLRIKPDDRLEDALAALRTAQMGVDQRLEALEPRLGSTAFDAASTPDTDLVTQTVSRPRARRPPGVESRSAGTPASLSDDLDTDQVELLCRFVTAYRKAPRGQRGPFRCRPAIQPIGFGPSGEPPANYVVSHPGNAEEMLVSRYDLEMLDRANCIRIYAPPLPVAMLSPAKIGSFDVEPAGFDFADHEAARRTPDATS